VNAREWAMSSSLSAIAAWFSLTRMLNIVSDSAVGSKSASVRAAILARTGFASDMTYSWIRGKNMAACFSFFSSDTLYEEKLSRGGPELLSAF